MKGFLGSVFTQRNQSTTLISLALVADTSKKLNVELTDTYQVKDCRRLVSVRPSHLPNSSIMRYHVHVFSSGRDSHSRRDFHTPTKPHGADLFAGRRARLGDRRAAKARLGGRVCAGRLNIATVAGCGLVGFCFQAPSFRADIVIETVGKRLKF